MKLERRPAMKAKKFPETILVRWDGDDEPYLVAWDNLEDAAPPVGEKHKVARYTLAGVVTIETTAREVKAPHD
jgi:hypothetical protein